DPVAAEGVEPGRFVGWKGGGMGRHTSFNMRSWAGAGKPAAARGLRSGCRELSAKRTRSVRHLVSPPGLGQNAPVSEPAVSSCRSGGTFLRGPPVTRIVRVVLLTAIVCAPA